MSRNLTILNDTFQYPDPGENPGWGEDATEWAQAVTDLLNDISNSSDIPLTIFAIADNVSIFTNIVGLAFDNSIVRSFECDYNVVRTNGVTTTAESGKFYGVYNGSTWAFSHQNIDDAGMTFTITSLGQVQYKSSSVGGTYSGTMRFSAKTFQQ